MSETPPNELGALPPCIECDGRGTVGDMGAHNRPIRVTCYHCFGTGKEGGDARTPTPSQPTDSTAMSDTPETDKAIYDSDGQWSMVLRDTCRRLERERDEALERERVAITSFDEERQRAIREAERVLEAHRERDQVIRERDEDLKENARLRMELDGTCNVEGLRQVRAERDDMKAQLATLSEIHAKETLRMSDMLDSRDEALREIREVLRAPAGRVGPQNP